jgi:hypothetical protein
MDGKLRALVGVADADINLDFFGLGGERCEIAQRDTQKDGHRKRRRLPLSAGARAWSANGPGRCRPDQPTLYVVFGSAWLRP